MSSKNAMAKNINSTNGKKPKTPPRPPISPSTTKDCVSPSGITLAANSPAFSKNVSNKPTTGSEKVKVNLKMAYITRAKIGIPTILFKITVSILSDKSCRFSIDDGFNASVHAPLINP